MIFRIKGEGLSPFALLLAEGRISAAGENRKGMEKLYFPILKTITEKLGGASHLVLYFNEEMVSEIEVAALSGVQGMAEKFIEPLQEAACEWAIEDLMRIDSCLPELLAAVKKEQERTGRKEVKALLQAVTEKNPLAFPRPDFYSYKWKQYLLAAFGGACGGYVKVSRDGERLDFHIYDRDHFAEYLLEHARFDMRFPKSL